MVVHYISKSESFRLAIDGRRAEACMWRGRTPGKRCASATTHSTADFDLLSMQNSRLFSGESDTSKKHIMQALHLAWLCHRKSFRRSGEPYVTHPAAVASIVAHLGLGETSRIAALLHDLVEDEHLGLAYIKDIFGDDIAAIVDGLTELGKAGETLKGEITYNKIMLKLLEAGSKDLRVLVIKLADRLHNMRTLAAMPEKKQRAKALETLSVYVPIANILGMWDVKRELEDLSFKYLEPKLYDEILKRRAHIVAVTEKQMCNEIIPLFKAVLPNCKIVSEQRSVYEIFQRLVNRKMISSADKQIEFGASDVWRLQIIAKSTRDCYLAEATLHAGKFPAVNDEPIQHWIGHPTKNGHEYLHSYVMLPGFGDGKLLVQIRTSEMLQRNRFGVASTARGNPNWSKQNPTWLKAAVVELGSVGYSTQEVFDIMRKYCEPIRTITLNGQENLLPDGSTFLDFAAEIHSELMLTAVGAKINGCNVTDWGRPLRDEDRVEIITDKERANPNLDWLNWAHTPKARKALRAYLRKQKGAIDRGSAALDMESKAYYISAGNLAKTKLFEQYCSRRNYKNADELFIAIGNGEINAAEVTSDIVVLYRYYLEKRRSAKKVNLKQFSLMIETKDRRRLSDGIIHPLSVLGFDISEYFFLDLPGSGRVVIVIGVNVVGGRRGGDFVGQMQRAQIKEAVRRIGQKGDKINVLGKKQVRALALLKAGSFVI